MPKSSPSLTFARVSLVGALIHSASASAAPPKLTATEIIDRNLSARGGITAWRAVQSLTWSGKIDAGGRVKQTGVAGKPVAAAAAKTGVAAATAATAEPSGVPAAPAQAQLPFLLDMQRPRKTRLEIEFAGQTAVQVYDGEHGWKLRPFLNRHDVESMTAELETVANEGDLDGQLIDYAAKGTRVEVEGAEAVEGQDAYKLKFPLKDNRVIHEWIDAGSFLEVKIEDSPRKPDNRVQA